MYKLNTQQQEASEFIGGICAVIAVPGSGKTLTMMHRIATLIDKHGIPPENILGLTFTRNAAEQMRQRLHSILNDKAERVTLSTIHSFCHSVLKNEGFVYEILSGKEQILFIKKVIKDLKIKNISTGMALREISLSKNNLISHEEYRDLYTGDKTMLAVADIYEQYDKEKTDRMLMDFDDLLVNTCRLFQQRQDIRDRYREAFSHLLVDEFQDTNPAQMEILRQLITEDKTNSSFWICGDDSQAIYSFNGATVMNILKFREIFPNAVEFILNVNYRSTPQIIRACQRLINHNTKKIEKSLKTDNADGQDITVIECINEEDEAIKIMNEIINLTNCEDKQDNDSTLTNNQKPSPNPQGLTYKDIAILYRCNFQSRIIEEVFTENKIPYYIEKGINFYDRQEVRIIIDYLKVIDNPESEQADESLINILNIPNRYISRKFVNDLQEYATDRGIHLYSALKEIPIKLPYIRHNVKDFISLIDRLIQDRLEPSTVMSLLRVSLDIDGYATDDEIPDPDDTKIANLNELQLAASKYKDTRSFLKHTEIFNNKSELNNEEGVRLMTIHKAKGLEFPVVFVTGLVEGILPTKKGDIEEERRICFVGISRAMRLLYLTYYTSCLNGQTAKKSVFLDEIMDEDNQTNRRQ